MPDHFLRLERSLASLKIDKPHAVPDWIRLQDEMIRRNAVDEGMLYPSKSL